MKAVFVELPAFSKWRSLYLSDELFQKLQLLLMANPETGDMVPLAGGVRKMRFSDSRRGKGKRGGLRVIYFWWPKGSEFWLFTLYDKNEAADLTADQCKSIGRRIKAELSARSREHDKAKPVRRN